MNHQLICSADNTRIKLAAALRQKKYRDESGLFLIEGIHLVETALAANWNIECLFVCQEQLATAQFSSLLDRYAEKGKKVLLVSAPIFKKMAETESPQGIIAIVQQSKLDLLTDTGALTQQGSPFWVILDAVQDPGNVGTIIRTADAAGATGVVLTPGCADLYAGKTVRASMGSLFHLPIYKSSVKLCLEHFSGKNIPLFVADANSATNYNEFDLTATCAVVFGNEGAGVSEAFRQHAASAIRIPIIGKAESLNVASAAAVILFEAARQRGFPLS